MTSLCSQWTKNKCFVSLLYAPWYEFEKQIRNSRWTKTNLNEVMQSTTSNSNSRPIFPYHVHNKAFFENPFINGRGFIYLGILKMGFTF